MLTFGESEGVQKFFLLLQIFCKSEIVFKN